MIKLTFMSSEHLHSRDPKHAIHKRVNVDVLKQRLYERDRVEKRKTTITVSAICVTLGAIAIIVS